MYHKAELIIQQVSLQHGVPVNMLTSKGRLKHVAAAKRDCRRRLRYEADLSWGEINMLLSYSRHYHRL